MNDVFAKKAYIFDLDGTLADSMHVWDTIARDWLLAHGFFPGDDLEEIIADMTLQQSAEYIIAKLSLSATPQELIDDWMNMVYTEYAQTISLKQGVYAFLESCCNKGILMAIATSCFPKACEELLKRTGIRTFFQTIVYSDEVGKNKTHPDIYLLAAKRLGILPQQCVVFEDTYFTLQGVRKAGMQIVAVYDSTCSDWERFSRESDGCILEFNKNINEL